MSNARDKEVPTLWWKPSWPSTQTMHLTDISVVIIYSLVSGTSI